nr:MAG TPA: hypothetical protein [Caudoviricetes sp.]
MINVFSFCNDYSFHLHLTHLNHLLLKLIHPQYISEYRLLS